MAKPASKVTVSTPRRVREYEAGYRREPEGHREIEAATAVAVRLLAAENW